MSIFGLGQKSPKEKEEEKKRQQRNGGDKPGFVPLRHTTRHVASGSALAGNTASNGVANAAERARVMAESRRVMTHETDYSIRTPSMVSQLTAPTASPQARASRASMSQEAKSLRSVKSNDVHHPVNTTTATATGPVSDSSTPNKLQKDPERSRRRSRDMLSQMQTTTAAAPQSHTLPSTQTQGKDYKQSRESSANLQKPRDLPSDRDSQILVNPKTQIATWGQKDSPHSRPQLSSDSGYGSVGPSSATDSLSTSDANGANNNVVSEADPSRLSAGSSGFIPKISNISLSEELAKEPVFAPKRSSKDRTSTITPAAQDKERRTSNTQIALAKERSSKPISVVTNQEKASTAPKGYVSRLDPGPTESEFAKPLRIVNVSPKQTKFEARTKPETRDSQLQGKQSAPATVKPVEHMPPVTRPRESQPLPVAVKRGMSSAAPQVVDMETSQLSPAAKLIQIARPESKPVPLHEMQPSEKYVSEKDASRDVVQTHPHIAQSKKIFAVDLATTHESAENENAQSMRPLTPPAEPSRRTRLSFSQPFRGSPQATPANATARSSSPQKDAPTVLPQTSTSGAEPSALSQAASPPTARSSDLDSLLPLAPKDPVPSETTTATTVKTPAGGVEAFDTVLRSVVSPEPTAMSDPTNEIKPAGSATLSTLDPASHSGGEPRSTTPVTASRSVDPNPGQDSRPSAQKQDSATAPQSLYPWFEPEASSSPRQRSTTLPPVSVLEGFKVNKRGKILDEEGEPIGELFEGELIDCVRQKVNARGDVVDEYGAVVGRVRTLARNAASPMTWPNASAPLLDRQPDLPRVETQHASWLTSPAARPASQSDRRGSAASQQYLPRLSGPAFVAELDGSEQAEAAPVMDHSDIFIPEFGRRSSRPESPPILKQAQRQSSQPDLQRSIQPASAIDRQPKHWASRNFEEDTPTSDRRSRSSHSTPRPSGELFPPYRSNSRSSSHTPPGSHRVVIGPTLESLIEQQDTNLLSSNDANVAESGSANQKSNSTIGSRRSSLASRNGPQPVASSVDARRSGSLKPPLSNKNSVHQPMKRSPLGSQATTPPESVARTSESSKATNSTQRSGSTATRPAHIREDSQSAPSPVVWKAKGQDNARKTADKRRSIFGFNFGKKEQATAAH